MAQQTFLIAPIEEGLINRTEPWLIPNNAFAKLENAYVWRGKIRKKSGYTFLGRLHLTPEVLPEDLGVTSNLNIFTATLANVPISPGTVVINVATIPALIFTDNGNGTLTSPTTDINYGTIDYENGTFILNFSPTVPLGTSVKATSYRYLNRSPVMGLSQYETGRINSEDLIAFDQDFSYKWNSTTQQFDQIVDLIGNWTSTNSDFFWTHNYFTDALQNELLWTVNNIPDTIVGPNTFNGIKYYNGSSWIQIVPQLDSGATRFLRTALILIAYKDRLIALNTQEGPATPASPINYPNRARWSQNGTPLNAANSWLDDVVGKGGYIDAPTIQKIVSAEFIKDKLVVFFERSTWTLTYTGNEILPFVWVKINTELGAESTFSPVPFDRGIFAVGDKGIISTDSVNVARIDQQIPDEVYNIHNENDGPKRVQGIRDFNNQLVFWTFPSDDANGTFPDRLLVYNYIENSYAYFRDSFTTLGRYQRQSDYTWATLPYPSWSAWNIPWGSPYLQSDFPNIIGGNQQGFVMIFENRSPNDQSLDLNNSGGPSITATSPAIVKSINHNLQTNQFIKFRNIRGFIINIPNEILGNILATDTFFRGSLQNIPIPAETTITLNGITFQDVGDGTLNSTTIGASGTIDYRSGDITLTFVALGSPGTVTANYDYNILNEKIFLVENLSADTFAIFSINPNTGTSFPVDLSTYSDYLGSGEIIIIDNFDILTKRFSPLISQAKKTRFSFVDFLMDVTDTGKFAVSARVNQSQTIDANEVVMDTTNIEELGINPAKIWQRAYLNVIGEFIQLRFFLNNQQIIDEDIAFSDWLLHAFSINVQSAGRIL